MNAKNFSLIAALTLGGLFVGAAPVSAQQNATNAAPARAQGRQFPSVDQQVDRLKQQLQLTDAQVPKVKAIIEERYKKMAELRSLPREERMEKMKSSGEAQNAEFKKILTPEQFQKWEKVREARGRAFTSPVLQRTNAPAGTN